MLYSQYCGKRCFNMDIVVLCGGLSPERNVSLSSGTKIASALMELGHRVVLCDMFFGLEDYAGELDGIFNDPPALGGCPRRA